MKTAIDIQKLVPAWQVLTSLAPVSQIESKTDYEQATALLNNLLDIVRDEADHPLYSLLTVVGDLIET